jgi:hypothetical protein
MNYKNILLHTFADRWVNGGKETRSYSNLLTFNEIERPFLENLDDPASARLENQQERLEKAEEKFYNKIFPNKSIEDFPSFIRELNDKIGGIRPCLEKLSNYDKVNSLYRDILNNIEITTDFTAGGEVPEALKGKTAKQIKEETAFVKAGTEIRISYVINGEKMSWDISGMLDSMIESRKKQTKQEFVSLLEMEEIFLPKIIKKLPQEVGKPDTPFTLSQIIGKMSKHFIHSFSQSFDQEVSEEVLKVYNNQVMQLTGQKSLLGRDIHKGKVKDIIYLYITKGTALNAEVKQDFDKAFNKAWGKVGKSIIANLKLNKKGSITNNNKFTGDMGELSNLIMAYYISPEGMSSIEWTGQNKDEYGKDARADVFLAGMGIQVKNFKKKNMDSSVIIKLHPFQLLNRLSETGMTKTGQEEMAEIMANLSFNKNFREGHYEDYINKFEEVAKNYASAFLNFSFNLTEFEGFQDTVNFWQVGNIIVPSSAILKAYIDSYKKTKNFITTFKFPKPKLDDSAYHESKDGHHPPFADYWGYSGDGGWRVRKDTQDEKIKNLLSDEEATIHTKFKFNKATFGDILSKNAYLFIT